MIHRDDARATPLCSPPLTSTLAICQFLEVESWHKATAHAMHSQKRTSPPEKVPKWTVPSYEIDGGTGCNAGTESGPSEFSPQTTLL